MKSMTSYARTEGVLQQRRCVIEIRTVNHRFCDINLKLPRALSSLEMTVKKHLSSRIVRGRVDMTVQWENGGEGDVHLSLNMGAARELHALLGKLKEEFHISEEVGLSHLLHLRDAVISVEKIEEFCDDWTELQPLVDEALESLVTMRKAEGEMLKKDLQERVKILATLAQEVEDAASRLTETIRERLFKRFEDANLSATVDIDEGRLLSEVFLLAERADITEELVRIKSHLQQFEGLFKSSTGSSTPLLQNQVMRIFHRLQLMPKVSWKKCASRCRM